jgi:hypothetical protein
MVKASITASVAVRRMDPSQRPSFIENRRPFIPDVARSVYSSRAG